MSSIDSINYIIRYHKGMMILGLIGLPFYISILFLLGETSVEPWMYAVLICMVVISLALILAYFNWRLIYNDTYFTIRNTLGITRTYRFDQITGIKYGSDIAIYLGEKHVIIDPMAVNRAHFICFANNRYKHYHNDRLIPCTQQGFDILNGNVDRGNYAIGILAFVWCLFVVETINAVVKDNLNTNIIIILIAAIILLSIMIVLAIIAGRDPQKHQKLFRLIYDKYAIDPVLKDNMRMLNFYIRTLKDPAIYIAKNGKSPHKDY